MKLPRALPTAILAAYVGLAGCTEPKEYTKLSIVSNDFGEPTELVFGGLEGNVLEADALRVNNKELATAIAKYLEPKISNEGKKVYHAGCVAIGKNNSIQREYTALESPDFYISFGVPRDNHKPVRITHTYNQVAANNNRIQSKENPVFENTRRKIDSLRVYSDPNCEQSNI